MLSKSEFLCLAFALEQQFSTWVLVPLGVRKQFAGSMRDFKIYQNKPTKGKEKCVCGVREGGQF
jgi:hypothetical protein